MDGGRNDCGIADTFQVMAPAGGRKRKFNQKAACGKEGSEGGTSASVRCFKFGESGYRVAESKMAYQKCFKCRKKGLRIAECRSNSLTCYSYGEKGHISIQCEKPKKTQSKGKVITFTRAYTIASDNLI
ncbi:uncharacterized protein LOC127080085 [Lathyrus oleraceus]|uniref:uncharacterized protein LOC127080085 n=1 Tax=Pisum sativum TaxID=3888 RepID=UPI0021CF665C|nr:uncharacterized protein LOC127080085 [Pisum sativum]